MKRVVTGAIAVAVLAGLGVVIWFFATSGIDESTADVTAPTLAPAPTEADPTTGSTAAEPPPASEGAQSPSAGGVFQLAEGTTVRFELDEELRGQPTHVVATNTEVEGQVRFDPADLSTAEIGTIVVGAQTFETDSSNRNRAIRGPILDASSFPEITFVPTSVDGLSGSVDVGQEVSFTVTGDLTIRDVTQTVTFEVTATLSADETLEGTAETQVLRSDFGLQIPSVQSVANVTDEVLIAIDFVATLV